MSGYDNGPQADGYPGQQYHHHQQHGQNQDYQGPPGGHQGDRAVGGDGIAGRDTRLLEARCRSQIAEEAGQSTDYGGGGYGGPQPPPGQYNGGQFGGQPGYDQGGYNQGRYGQQGYQGGPPQDLVEVAEEVAGPIDLGAVRPGTPVARNDLGCIHLDRSPAICLE
jgi:hypothetical protein